MSPLRIFGIILLVIGLIIGIVGLAELCSTNILSQALTGYPSCSTTFGVSVFGFILFVIGIILIAVGKEKPKVFQPPQGFVQPQPTQAPQQPSQGLFCRNCGNRLFAGSRFCNNCGTQVI